MSVLPTPGARVRATTEGVVRLALNGELVLVSGTTITPVGADTRLEILEPGFQTGDVVHDGDTQLMRVTPADAAPFWFASNGHAVYDDATDPTRMRLVARGGAPVQAGGEQQS